MRCAAAQTCANADGSSNVAYNCPSGYFYLTANDGASLVNSGAVEATNTAACCQEQTCADTDGSSTAATCGNGATCGEGGTDDGYTCTCEPGFAGDPAPNAAATCVDVDECTVETHTCDDNAACTNVVGSFTCACNSGYTGDGQTGNCAADDCSATVPAGPGFSTNCDNFVTDQTCTQSCDPGYHHNGQEEGSETYECSGGVFSGTLLTCEDINECDADPLPCGPAPMCSGSRISNSEDCSLVAAFVSSPVAANCPTDDGCSFQGGSVCSQTSNGVDATIDTYFCACSEGAIGGGQQTQCTLCEAGKFQDLSGQSSCDFCAAGTYAETAGLFACINCPAGTSMQDLNTGSSDSNECILCRAGTYSELPGGLTSTVAGDCTHCAVGQYMPDVQGSTAAADCVLCGVGKYNDQTGSALETSCIDCAAGRFSAAEGNDEAVDCILCGAGKYVPSTGNDADTDCLDCAAGSVTTVDGSFWGQDGATGCEPCAAGSYSPLGNVGLDVDCIACPAGSMTSDVDDPAAAQFVATGATGCALCHAPVGSDLPASQNVESCAAVSTLPDDTEFCSNVVLSGDAAAKETACETSQGPDGDRCIYTAAAAADARGYADHDSSSATECRACDVGEFVDSDGQVAECIDYDECQSNPCENGATCSETFAAESPYPEYDQNVAPDFPGGSYTCQCGHGFSGNVCQLLDECALNPCEINIADAPGTDPGSDANRFQCPVSLQCTDSDLTDTDSYVCACPSCSSVMLSDTTTGLLTTYFDTHPAIGRYVASGVASTLTDPSGLGTCRDPARTGCMDENALNYDPTAAVPDNSACVARVYGCMDPRATNYDASANSYDPTGVLGEACKAAYCQAPAQCVAIVTTDGANAECGTAEFVGEDLADHRRACEAKGAPGTTYYESGIGVPTNSVCRFEPPQKTLCPYTAGDVNEVSAAHDSECTCPDASAALLLESLNGGAGLDECASATYDGSQVGACTAPAHRICAEGRGQDGWAGRTCTDYREAFECPDDANGFVCSDPNPMWLDDFACSCVYDNGRYADADSTESCVATDPGGADVDACAAADISGDAAASEQACADAGACTYTAGNPVASSCGTNTVFTDSRATEAIVVSNYGMTLFLERDATTRNHICRLIHQPPDSDCARGTL